MGIFERGSLTISIGGNREISFDLNDDDEIWFNYEEGHCGSCVETDSTAGLNAKELFNLLYDIKGYMNDKVKETLENKNKELKELQNKIKEKEDRINTLTETLKVMKGVE